MFTTPRPQRGVSVTVWDCFTYMYLKLSFQDGGRPPQEELVVTGLHWGHGLNHFVCLFPLRLRSWEYPHRLNTCKRPEAHLQSSRWHVYNTSPSQVCLYSHHYSSLRQPCPHLHHHLELWEPRTTCIRGNLWSFKKRLNTYSGPFFLMQEMRVKTLP